MSVAQTKAAAIMQKHSHDMTSHQVISLLLAGALERVGQAKTCLQEENEKDKEILVAKLIAIINGLRNSLNMEEGGDIAVNLESLYEYMINRLGELNKEDELRIFSEIEGLILEVKSGWDAIDVGLKPVSVE